mgnify:CR=1 FL=1
MRTRVALAGDEAALITHAALALPVQHYARSASALPVHTFRTCRHAHESDLCHCLWV